LRAYPEDFGLAAETVSFHSRDGIALKAWYIPTAGHAEGTIILAHGIDGNRSDMLSRAAFLVRDHYNALLVDLRDHGESAGDYASPGYMEALDVLGALDYLEARGAPRPFFALGHSYGGVAVLWSAAESPDISAVISDSAYISFADMVRRATWLLAQDPARSVWERLGLRVAGMRGVTAAMLPVYYLRTGVWMDGKKADTLRAIARIGNRPILCIAGEEDKICPPVNAKRMYQAASSPRKAFLIVPGADHAETFSHDPKLYESAVVSFLHSSSN
jgi:pimeloyl-ACP methyl ester carboxylesterase